MEKGRRKERKVFCKVSNDDYNLLATVAEAYGFRGVYHMTGAIIRGFLRYVHSLTSDIDDPATDSIAREVEEMFEESVGLPDNGSREYSTRIGK